MVILKKIKAATLIETLTASVLIFIVFVIAGISFSNLFNSFQKSDTSGITNKMKEIEYKIKHNQVKIPYQTDFMKWEISVVDSSGYALIEAERSTRSLKKTIQIP